MQMVLVERNFAQEPSEVQLVSFLRQLEFASDLTSLDCQALAELVEFRTVPAGQVILGEGEKSEALFAVWSGAAEVLKGSTPDDLSQIAPLASVRPGAGPAGTSDHVKVTVLERGAIFGEMSFVDHRPTSATVRAVSDTTLLVWQRDQLKSGPEGLNHRLLRGVAVALIARMRSLTVAHVRALRDQLHQAEARLQFARFFGVTLVLFAIASTVQKLIHTGLPPLWQMLYSWGFLLLSFAPIAWFAVRQRLPPRDFGLTLGHAKRNLRDAAVISLALGVVALAARLILRKAGEPLLNWGSIASYSGLEAQVFFAAYLPHCFLQEFIGRGVIQTSLARLMPNARPATAILMTSGLFGIYHFYVSVSFALTTFAVSLAFGWLFYLHRSLLGVTLVHVALGVLSIAFGFN